MTPHEREVMQMALDALQENWRTDESDKAIEAIRARLAQPEQEPVAWMYEYGTDHGDAVNQIFWHKNLRLEKPTGLVRNVVPLYTAPPQREWVGLTDGDVNYCVDAIYKGFNIKPRNEIEIKYFERVIKFVEAKLKEKNT